MKYLIERARLVFAEPTTCWKKLHKTRRDETLKFLAALLVVSAVLSLIMTAVNMGTAMLSMYLVPLAVTLVISFVLSLVAAWLVNLVLGWMGAKGNWDTALQAVAYGSTPSALLGWIPVVGFIGVIWSLVVQVIGLKTMYKTTYAKAILAVIICGVIFGAIMFGLTLLFGASMTEMMGMAGSY